MFEEKSVNGDMTPAGHMPVLDGVRGLAILLVMMVHLTVMNSGTFVDRSFYYVAFLGWVGVDLFFVLSGYLITGILYALIAAALVLRTAMVIYDTHPAVLYVLPFTRMDALAVGSAIAIIQRRQGLAALRRAAQIADAITAAVLVAVTVWDRDPTWSAATQSVGYTAIGLMFGALLVTVLLAAPREPVRRLFTSRFLRRLGIHSYALYLIHLPVRARVRDHLFGPEQFPTVLGSQLPGQLLFYAVAMAPAVVLAWLMWHLLEQPFLRLKRWFPMEMPASPAAAAHPLETGIGAAAVK